MKKLILVFCFLLITLPVWAARENKPDPQLTPGEIATSDIALVCKHGYSKSVRKTTREMKNDTYRAYRVGRTHKGYKIDHLVPLSLGGADSINNIWPSDFKAGKYNAAAKDRLEIKVRDMVCGGLMDVKTGQALFVNDWQKAYDRYCPTRYACPSYEEIQDQNRTDSFHYRWKTKDKK